LGLKALRALDTAAAVAFGAGIVIWLTEGAAPSRSAIFR
jgi:hypothetical protein